MMEIPKLQLDRNFDSLAFVSEVFSARNKLTLIKLGLIIASLFLTSSCSATSQPEALSNSCFKFSEEQNTSMFTQADIDEVCSEMKNSVDGCNLPQIQVDIVSRQLFGDSAISGQYFKPGIDSTEPRIEIYDFGVFASVVALEQSPKKVLKHEYHHGLQFDPCYTVPISQIGYPVLDYVLKDGRIIMKNTIPQYQGKVKGAFCIKDQSGTVRCTKQYAAEEIEADFVDSEEGILPSSYSANSIAGNLRSSGYNLTFHQVSDSWTSAMHSENFWVTLQEQLSLFAGTNVDLTTLFETIANNERLLNDNEEGYVTFDTEIVEGYYLVTTQSCIEENKCQTKDIYVVIAPANSVEVHSSDGSINRTFKAPGCGLNVFKNEPFTLPNSTTITVDNVCEFSESLKE